jgi:hypothetical protein
MKTIIGVAGRDPITLDDYTILASLVSNNETNLFASSKRNYAIGATANLENYSKKDQSALFSLFENPAIHDENYIKEILGYLNEYIKKETNEESQFIFSMVEKSPVLKFSGLNMPQKPLAYAAIGSGIEKIMEVNTETPLKRKLNPFRQDGRIYLSRRPSLNTIYESLNEIAEVSRCSEGCIEAVIVDQSGIYIQKPIFLDKSSSLGTINKNDSKLLDNQVNDATEYLDEC